MQRRGARAAAQITVAVVAVAAALVLGFIIGAASQSAPVLEPLPPPAATLPMPIVVLARTLALPLANVSSSFATNGAVYWSAAYVGGRFTFAWTSPFAIDACADDNWTYAVNLDSIAACTSQNGSAAWMNATAGWMNFTVPSQLAVFVFCALSPRGFSGRVQGEYSITDSQGTTISRTPLDVYLPLGQPVPPFVWGNLSVSLPAGYNAVTVVGNASQSVSISFNLVYYYIGEWQPVRTTWNVTGYYPAPPQFNVTIMAMSPMPTTVNLGAVAFVT